jgi:non-specific serine/threonine protein kinase
MQRAARPLALAVALALGACTVSSPSPDASATELRTTAGASASPAPSTPAASETVTGAWTELADAPLARLEMAVAAHAGRIWLAGGLSLLGEAVSEVEVFDPSSGEWSSGPALPAGIHHAALVSDGERLLLIGGYIGASFSTPSDLVLTLADGADTWEEGPSLPDARGAGAAAWDGERVVYGGGVGLAGVSGDVFALAGGTWERIGAMPRAREHLAAASDGQGRTWLLGGRVGGLEGNLADVDLVEGASITALPSLPTPRGGVGAFFIPELGACLTGGEAPGEALRTVECVGPNGEISTAPDMNVLRHGHGAAVVDGVAYVLLGGEIPGLSAHASVERLDLNP